MARVFRDAARAAWRGAGFAGLISLWMRTVTDTVVNATREHVRGSDEGVAMSCWEVFAGKVRTQFVPVLAGIALLLTVLYGIWALAERWLPLAPAATRGWAVLITTIVLGLLLARVMGGSEKAVWWRRGVSGIGILGWVLWFATSAELGLAGFWAVILPWVPIMCSWPVKRDRSMAERTGVIVPADHVTFAAPALLLLLVAPVPYVATNVFLLFVIVINGIAAMLPPMVMKVRKGKVDAN